MSRNRARDQRRGGRGTLECQQRKRWQTRPTLMALEERKLLSTIVVNNPTDTPVVGQIDLRQAIDQANTNGGAETITFDSDVFATPQTITLGGSQLELGDTSGTETITGPSAGVTVSGAGLSRVFEVDVNVTASISGLTIIEGTVSGTGAGGWPGQLLGGRPRSTTAPSTPTPRTTAADCTPPSDSSPSATHSTLSTARPRSTTALSAVIPPFRMAADSTTYRARLRSTTARSAATRPDRSAAA